MSIKSRLYKLISWRGERIKNMSVNNSNPLVPNIDSIKPGNWLGRYKIIKKYAEGAFKIVYLAETDPRLVRDDNDDGLKKLHVIKFLKPYSEITAESAKRSSRRSIKDERIDKFFREINLLNQKGSHSNIANIVDAQIFKIGGGDANEEGLLYFVEEYVEGKTLRDIMDETKKKKGILDRKFFEFTLSVFMDVFSAVHHLHSKEPVVAHLDLKPSNVLVSYDKKKAVVTDFGNSTLIGERDYPPAQGSRLYRSPEMLVRNKEERAKLSATAADMWSLGAMLYECLSGEYPFETSPSGWSDLDDDELRRVKDQLRYNIKQRSIEDVSEKNPRNIRKNSTIDNLVRDLLNREADERPPIHNALHRLRRAYNNYRHKYR